MSSDVQEFVDQYRRGNEGRDPFDDCLLRAGGIASWGYDEGHSEFLSTAIAEAMRLAMARGRVMSVADLRIDAARDEGSRRAGTRAVPGSEDWPAPVGQGARSWNRLFLDSGPEEIRLHMGRAEGVLAEFCVEMQERHPGVPSTFGTATRKFVNPVTGATFYGIA
ncbi:hypothetical protein [Streptomyces omiyaensis]|uniref:Uncharacterized protein n=1 Tax=Streptomyces omiyaensis TaxID=68247 RepID=A0ABW7BNX4_9ACTN|nr:hypothetical protein [Streptomyces omiyaensis]GGY54708.1 hypothetical protein GCM10010363_39970 [Streptomyces omiyaensis]